MSYKILDVELTKSTLAVKEQFIIRVSILLEKTTAGKTFTI